MRECVGLHVNRLWEKQFQRRITSLGATRHALRVLDVVESLPDAPLRVRAAHPVVTDKGNARRNEVGTVKVTIGVGDPQGQRFEDLEVTADTGRAYTAAPRELLRRLGVPVERSLPSETADGRVVPVDVGRTTIRLEGLEFATPVIFAGEGEPNLLGMVSLEEAALAVDPLAGRLIPANLLRL